jgi:hypothetical protein
MQDSTTQSTERTKLTLNRGYNSTRAEQCPQNLHQKRWYSSPSNKPQHF